MSRQVKTRREQRFNERFSGSVSQHLAIANEMFQIYKSIMKPSLFKGPIKFSRHLFKEPSLESPFSENRLVDLFSDIVLDCFNELGPVYGKAAQIILSRIDGEGREVVNRFSLNRLYQDWPPMDFSDVSAILDVEIPSWQDEFIVEPYPLGVASMAQVHSAVDRQGRHWVIKVIKPLSDKRLHETLDAIEQMIFLAKPLELTAIGRRTSKELRTLVRAMRHETNLSVEKRNIDRMREKLASKKQKVLRLPETFDGFCSQRVMTVEKFVGISLADVVGGHAQLNKVQRRKLARKMLQELLVQVFEIGLFHGDPHAGNLILLEDGTIGLFDWGLTGELEDADRHHISSMLRALMTWNMDRLIGSLEDIARDNEVKVERKAIEKEVKKVAKFVNKKKAAGEKPSLQELIGICFESASNLEIPVPDGLLMMAKSLVTIEGLAKGVDPEISMGRIASPLLLKVAKPDMKDLLSMGKNLPKLAGQFLQRS